MTTVIKPATQGQALEMISRFATQTPWGRIDHDYLQDEWIGLSPTAFAEKMLQVFSVLPKASSIIMIDRTVCPTYPDWVKSAVYPKIENKSPSTYCADKLDIWLHDDQKTGVVTGNVIHDYLKNNNMLEGCLGLRDLQEIQKKGIVFFNEHFKGKAVFGWKSIVRDADGRLHVPYLIEDDGKVVLYWFWLGDDCDSSNPALRFAS